MNDSQSSAVPDHRNIGRQLDLFAFSPLVGSGLPLFTPRGTIIREELCRLISELQDNLGYQRVTIPHIAKPDLYKASGHWDKFKEDIFHVRGKRDAAFALKPMNCPHHAQIFSSRPRSYRELPMRFAEVSTVYRDEQQGELQGLSRVRSITIDDGHVFCEQKHIKQEIVDIMSMIESFYRIFDMELSFRLSLRDPNQAEKYLGTNEIWNESESALRNSLRERGADFVEEQGEAAFYGPKIDFTAKDNHGRTWQLATLQLDFNMPNRLNLTYIDEHGKEQTPVMIHRAITGSLERFMAIVLEHFAGALPLWLSPEHVRLLSIGKSANDFIAAAAERMRSAGIRVETDIRDITIGKKILEGEKAKVPVLAIAGDREQQNSSLSIRLRGGTNEGPASITDVIERLQHAITQRHVILQTGSFSSP